MRSVITQVWRVFAVMSFPLRVKPFQSKTITSYRERYRFLEQFSNSHLIHKVMKEKGRGNFQTLAGEFLERGRRRKVFRQIPDELLMAHGFSPIIQLARREADSDFKMTRKKMETSFALAWESVASGKKE